MNVERMDFGRSKIASPTKHRRSRDMVIPGSGRKVSRIEGARKVG